jgi:hypothetical protein
MKKTILSICIFLAANSAFSQLVQLYNQVNSVTGTVADNQLDLTGWEVVNATSETIDFGCKRLGVQETPGHTSQFCWGIICSPFGTGANTSSEIVTLAPSAYSTSFYAHFRPNGVAGQTVIKYCWFDSNNPNNEFCYDVNYCIDVNCVIGIDESQKPAQFDQISPNPLSGTGNITYSFKAVPHSGKLSFYSATGALIKQVSLSKQNGAVIISAEDFENGIYFCTIENEGQVFETRKLVISK